MLKKYTSLSVLLIGLFAIITNANAAKAIVPETIQSLEADLVQNPDNMDAHLKLVGMYNEKGDFINAKKHALKFKASKQLLDISGSISVGTSYTDNANLGTESDTIMIDQLMGTPVTIDGAAKQKAAGWYLKGNIDASRQFTEIFALRGGASVGASNNFNSNLERTADVHNESISVYVGGAWTIKKHEFALSLGAGSELKEMSNNTIIAGPLATYSYQATNNISFHTDTAIGFINSYNDGRDGMRLTLGETVRFAANKNKRVLGLGLRFIKTNVESESFSNHGFEIFATHMNRLTDKLTLNLGVTYQSLSFDAPGLIIDLEKRLDNAIIANIGFDYAITNLISINVGYNYLVNDSTSAFYDYNRNYFFAGVKVGF